VGGPGVLAKLPTVDFWVSGQMGGRDKDGRIALFLLGVLAGASMPDSGDIIVFIFNYLGDFLELGRLTGWPGWGGCRGGYCVLWKSIACCRGL